jgi:hypothetical protein
MRVIWNVGNQLGFQFSSMGTDSDAAAQNTCRSTQVIILSLCVGAIRFTSHPCFFLLVIGILVNSEN